jgi:lipoate-protein ligase A
LLDASFQRIFQAMSDACYLLESGAQSPALNMAIDEALLESVSQLGRPVLRFYGWTEAAATFGYSQRFSDVCQWTSLRPLIRRPTGGGLVPHDADWTYSLVIPPAHEWYALKAFESYRRMHEWINRAFTALGLSTELAPSEQNKTPGQCFAGAEKFDLLCKGVKLAGAAQRRNSSGLLIQGSVQPRVCAVSRRAWADAMLDATPLVGAGWTRLRLEAATADRAEDLAQGKYSQPEYNQRR